MRPATASGAAPTVGAEQRRSPLPVAFWALALTYLAVALNMTVASVALPSISTDLAATSAQLMWIVNVTPIAGAALILFAGSWGDRFGRRRLLELGLLVFLVASLLSAVARSPEQLIVLRALTGAGSALAMPAALALVFAVVREESRRTAVGIIGGTQAVGSLLGPLLAGSLLVAFSWGAAFLAVVPLLAVSLVLTRWRIPPDAVAAPGPRHALDIPGASLVAVAAIAFLVAAVGGPALGGPVLGGLLLLGVLAVVALVWWERRCEAPIFLGSAVRRREFWVPTVTILLVQLVLGGVLFVSTQYVQLALGYSALAAGLFLVPALLVWVASSSTAGLTARRFGAAAVVIVGLLLSAVGLVVVGVGGLHPHLAGLVVGLLLLGAMGAAPALMTHLAVSTYPEARRTVGSAINSVAVRCGLAFGVAAFGSTLAWRYAGALAPSLADLPAGSADLADNSLGGALQVAAGLAPQGDALADAAREAFVSGFRLTMLAAAVLLVLVAMLVAVAAPPTLRERRRRPSADPRPDPADRPQPTDQPD